MWLAPNDCLLCLPLLVPYVAPSMGPTTLLSQCLQPLSLETSGQTLGKEGGKAVLTPRWERWQHINKSTLPPRV